METKSQSKIVRRSTEPTTSGNDRRQQIEEVALRAFCAKGYGGATIRDIAKELGTTLAPIYYYFVDKEDILFSIINRFTDDLLALLKEQFESTADPTESLRRAMLAQFFVQETRSLETRLTHEEKRSLSEEKRRQIVQREREIYDLYLSRVVELISSGKVRNFDPRVITFGLLGVINNFMYWFRPGRSVTMKQAAEQSIKMLLDGLLIHKLEVPKRKKSLRQVR